MILETLLGGVAGSVARLIPAGLEHLDKKNDRAHELAMFEKQLEADRLRAEQKIEEAHLEGAIALDAKQLDALRSGNAQQAQMAAAAGGSAAWLSATVRPFATYQLLVLYGLAKIATFSLMCLDASSARDIAASAATLYNENDMALLASIMSFWFLDRHYTKAK